MTHSHASNNKMGKEIMKGTIASASIHAGGQLMSKLTKNPTIIFGLGVVTGYLVYKYRKEIIASTTKVVDASKDFVLQQKENLEDLVAEAKESEQ